MNISSLEAAKRLCDIVMGVAIGGGAGVMAYAAGVGTIGAWQTWFCVPVASACVFGVGLVLRSLVA